MPFSRLIFQGVPSVMIAICAGSWQKSNQDAYWTISRLECNKGLQNTAQFMTFFGDKMNDTVISAQKSSNNMFTWSRKPYMWGFWKDPSFQRTHCISSSAPGMFSVAVLSWTFALPMPGEKPWSTCDGCQVLSADVRSHWLEIVGWKTAWKKNIPNKL